ncbi:hypothetical protein [Paenibacillus ferrarius]|nr:hypothetical protein [Paenibacillus ferrarius]
MEQPTKWLGSIRDLKLSYRKRHRILRKARDQAEINKDVATIRNMR